MVKKVNNKESISGIIFSCLSILLVVGIVIQIFIAGLAIFANPENWINHRIFVHLFELIPVFMLILSFIGSMPRWAIAQSAGVLGLIFLMYFTANATSIWPWAAAAHPIIAMVLFWSSIQLSKKSLTFMKREENKKELKAG
ncbi:DUF6220 domain-containing protein [Bacillus litorisediminis]|uniref:DUF6220 domain-containing protein n=1 Tax=Bacillus litorisediminis TaxID=2922713 RepID=UPI001FABAFD8|nr:DUF6220 domain-containing protein [Bacillus litorisediminis]